MLFELAHHGCNRGRFLPDGNINALNAGALLVNDGVYRDRRFAHLTVANNEFALATADRHHGVNRLEANLDWLIH